jgi:serine/threonine-protein kinase HipA
LPEGRHLAAVAAAADLPASDTYGLLARYGRDVAGAFEVTEGEAAPRTPALEPYTEDSLAAELAAIDENPLGIHDDSELSIAGLQDKLLVVQTAEGGWARPRYGYPSTHILKLESGPHGGLIREEAAGLELARRVGLVTYETWLEAIGDQEVLVVERFDRSNVDGAVRRLHQEDLLQSLGIQPESREVRAKYQEVGTVGPPSWWHLADRLDIYAEDRSLELTRLLRVMVFSLVLGNADAHAKNLALILEDGHAALAPLYDVVSTQLWPRLRRTQALTIADKNDPESITMDDLYLEAARWSLSSATAAATIDDLIGLMRDASQDLGHADLSALVRNNIENLVSRS